MQKYLITDGSRFIYKNHSGKYVPVSSESMADLYSKKQAEAILNNSISKPLRKMFVVRPMKTADKDVKPPDIEEIRNNSEKVMVSESIQKWLNKISDLNGLAADVNSRKQKLLSELKNIEGEKTDIEHYIEFTKLNASQGYKAFKMLKDCRIKRREIKNELAVLEIILGQKLGETVSDEIKSGVEGMDSRNYKPRVLHELFDL